MTRINLVDPANLSSQHLIAEYREIMRLPNNLRKSLQRKIPFKMSEIPNEYVLGKGHVKFFYNKMKFLRRRFKALVAEMLKRGYQPHFKDANIFIPDEKKFDRDYRPTPKAIKLNRARIKERSKVSRAKG